MGTPFGDRLVTIEHTIADYEDPEDEDIHETHCARRAHRGGARLPRLTELWIPRDGPWVARSLAPAFYEELGRVGNLTTLSICAPLTTDACVAAVCNMRLRASVSMALELVTSGVVDGILAGRAAGTLRRFEIENYILKEGGIPRACPVGPADRPLVVQAARSSRDCRGGSLSRVPR